MKKINNFLLLLLCEPFFFTFVVSDVIIPRKDGQQRALKGMKMKKLKGKKQMTSKNKKQTKKNKRARRRGRKLETCITGYPDSTTNVDITGKIQIYFRAMDMYIKYKLKNISYANLTESDPGFLQIHSGTACNMTVGPHWNDFGDSTANPNPWEEKTVSFYEKEVDNANEDSAVVGWIVRANNGFYWGENQGRAFVVVDNNLDSIGCGILSTEKAKDCFHDE